MRDSVLEKLLNGESELRDIVGDDEPETEVGAEIIHSPKKIRAEADLK